MRSTLHVVASACFLTVVAGLPTGVLARCTDLAAVCAARDKAEIQCPCAAATNHGFYVRCVRGVAKAEADALRLPRECKASVVRCASRSTCGRPGFVTCCRLDNLGQPHCSVKRSAANCKPPATIGTKPSCCDACASNNCPTTTTTTSTTSTTATTTTTIPSNCGNGHIDPGEACDGSDLGGVSCPGGSAGGAFVACNPDCTLDCSHCPGGVCEVICEPIVAGQPIPNTYQLVGVAGPKICQTNSTSNAFKACNSDSDCGGQSGSCMQTPWVTADGFAFGFPTGIKTTFTVAAADPAPTCSHAACVSCGDPNAACAGIPGCGTPPGAPTNGCAKNSCCDTPGFTVPTFNIPILGGLCGRVDQVACGAGVVNTSHPQTGDNEVVKRGDTTDPGADCTYGAGGDDCPSPTCKPCTPTGQGADTKGKIVRSVGNGSSDVSGVQFRIPTPMLATVWQDTANPCPDGSTFDNGESIITQLILNAEPTSAGATGSFTDLSGDGCARAGAGFSTSNNDGPITVGPTVARPQSYDGTLGPIEVAAGPVFAGSAPLYDIGFIAILPSSPATVVAAESCTCVPVAGCPE